MNVRIEIIEDPDSDDKWRAKIVDQTTGQTLHTTIAFLARRHARKAAAEWIEKNSPTRNA